MPPRTARKATTPVRASAAAWYRSDGTSKGGSWVSQDGTNQSARKLRRHIPKSRPATPTARFTRVDQLAEKRTTETLIVGASAASSDDDPPYELCGGRRVGRG